RNEDLFRMTPTNAPARVAPLTAKRESLPVDVAERSTTSSRDINREFIKPLLKSHRGLPRPPFDCVALVLQGGGALGAFQAGVYQALAEANLHPDWVAGISIGAINCGLIAGTHPKHGLKSCALSGSGSPRSSCSIRSVSPTIGCAAIWGTLSSIGCAPERPCSRALPRFP